MENLQHIEQESTLVSASLNYGSPYSKAPFIQPKLSINTPGDTYEQEADAMADKVMRMAIPNQTDTFFKPAITQVQRKHHGTDELDDLELNRKEMPSIQRKCAACEQEDMQVHRKESSTSEINAGNDLDSYVSSLHSSGAPLPENSRSFFEPRFGHDFSNVRIHTDSVAAKSAQSINALAYTTGNNIVFNQGQYSPNSESGQRLIAHELTHTIQQGANPAIQSKLIQRDLAVDPTAPNAVGRTLSTSQMNGALHWNQVVFTDPEEIALIRDVLGCPEQPPVIDETFVNALVQYQANFGLTQDGLLGGSTALRLANELQGEATYMGAAADTGSATEMALTPAQRRMRLRSRVANRLGNLMYQGFVGASDNPSGIVTVRSGVDYQTMCGGTLDCRHGIQLNYTGSNADNAHWLQFMHIKMFATHPTTHATVFQTGNTIGSGGALAFSNNTTTHWTVDSSSAANPFYEAGFTNERTAGASTSTFDQPQGWQGVANTFAGSGTFPSRPATVTLVLGFDSHVIINNRSVYHVRWNISFNFNTSGAATADTRGAYTLITAGSTRGLPATLETALLARYAGSPIR